MLLLMQFRIRDQTPLRQNRDSDSYAIAVP